MLIPLLETTGNIDNDPSEVLVVTLVNRENKEMVTMVQLTRRYSEKPKSV